ncbi:MAG: TonB-dependent receptor plug domain-containing protein, partial [Flavobacteriaceae bacterium]|nr:TonB-dependent receptor plug domain-containing protein [Flavobacteriaceae bacterium]
ATLQSNLDSTLTNENGYFELKIPSINQEINVRFFGFKPLSIKANEFYEAYRCNTIYLVPDEHELTEIILSHYLVKGIDKLNDGSFEIDFSKFTMLPGLIESDVLFSMQSFPGIQSINETVSNINIRGGTHDQNLILWDDIKMYQSGHFFGLISIFNPLMTQKVSLQKNGTQASHTDGVSGSIHMKTNDEINQSFKGNFGANFISTDGFADIPLSNKSSIQVAARKSINDFIKTPTYEEYFDRISQDSEVELNTNNAINSNKEFDFYDTSLRWLYHFSKKDKIQVNFINVSNELVFNENANIDEVEKSKESSISQNSIAGGIHYYRAWSEKVKTILHIYETDYKLKAINANLFDEQRFLQENSVSETGLKAQLDFKLKPQIKLESGYNFTETKVSNLDDIDSPLYRSLIAEVVRSHSVYSQLHYKSSLKNNYISAGLRLNYLDKFDSYILEPRISFNQRFLTYFNFEILGEFKHQISSHIINSQNDFLGIEKRRWQLSNDDDIPIMKSKQISTSISFSKNSWLINGEAYYKNIKGITTQSQGFQNQYEFVKTDGSYSVLGGDILVRKSVKNTSFWLSYSIMNNEYTFDSLSEERFPSNLDIKQAVTLGSSYTNKGFSVSTGFNWHTGKPYTTPIENNEIFENSINYHDTNNQRLDDYMRVDLSASYTVSLTSKTNIEVGFSIWNLLNQKNIINKYYKIEEEEIVSEFTEYSLGLTPNANIRVVF